ncbi:MULTISPECIES: GrpB family protein [Neorhizobium]|uniref:GrpB family protein n=1 Tax=Neorhizobium TaxID=1525371 RepID=UPI000CFA3D63|nr:MULTISPECIES: GrpB family protein [Neorhizobium]
MPTPVEIVDYDPSWPACFAEAAHGLAALLGDMVVSIDHVGSTSVPGLAAKPLIDIDVTLRSTTDIPASSTLLHSLGYEPRGSRHGDGVWAFLLRGEPGQRVYLCPPDNETHRKRMLFRDRLRADADLAAAYERLKRDLALEFPLDGDGYTSAKSEFIRAAMGTTTSVKLSS